MMAELIDRKQLKADMKNLLRDAQVSPKGMAALYLALLLALDLVTSFLSSTGIVSTFFSILASLMGMVLGSGFVLYCMAIRRGERAEYLTLFDGFSFVGKIIGLNIVMYIFIWLWSMLFIIPGFIAAYRYRFALYNLYENPGIGIMEALDMSKQQTLGYKGQLFTRDLSYLGWTLLASVPSMVESTFFYEELFSDAMTYIDSSAQVLSAVSAAPSAYEMLPAWGWVLISGLWSLVVSLFYLPNYQCVELGYFEIAKSTSGVGEGASPRNSNPWNSNSWNNDMGPDGLGGL